MATYYWVGGAGTWNASSTTNWASSSGGTGGAGVPTSADDVIFDTNSGTGTVTVTAASAKCKNITVTATQAITLSGTLSLCYGSLSYPTGGSFTSSIAIIFVSTTTGNTLNFGDKSLASALTFQGVGGEWTLSSNVTSTQVFNFYSGTFNAGSNSLTLGGVTLGNGSAFTLNMQSATFNLGGANPWNFTNTTNFTINSGTSTIVITQNASAFNGQGYTYYNLSRTNVQGSWTINGANTFNNVTISATASTTLTTSFSANQTINGTLSVSGGSSSARIQFGSSVAGTQRTLSVATIGTLTNTNFKDIALTGAASPWTAPLGVWDLGNNSGITFDTTTLYWVGGGGSWQDGTHWSNSSGGAAAGVQPGPSNDIVFDTNSGTGSVTGSGTYCKDLTSTASQSLQLNTSLTIYGSVLLPSGGSFSFYFNTAISFAGTTTGKTITLNGKSLPAVTFNGIGSEWTLTDNFITGQGFNITNGSVIANISTLTVQNCLISAGASLTLGNTVVTLNGGQNWNCASGATFVCGTSTIQGMQGFFGGNKTYYNVIAPNSVITGANTFTNLTLAASVSGIYTTTIAANQTVTGTLTCTGANGTAKINVRTDTNGVQRTITAATTVLTDVNFYGIVGAGTATWSGTRVGDAALNSGITFDAPKTVYWNQPSGGNWLSNSWATTSGGTPASTNYPLPQDTAIIENTGLNSGATISTYPYAYILFPKIDCSTRTLPVVLKYDQTGAYMCGDLIFNSAVSFSNSNIPFEFFGAPSISASGTTIIAGVVVTVGASLTISNTLTSSSSLTNNGTLTLGANATFTTCTLGAASTTNFSTNRIIVTGSTAAVFTGNNTQIVTGTPIVEATYSGANTIAFTANAPSEANTISAYVSSTTGPINISGSFRDVNFTGSSGTLSNQNRIIYGNLTVSSGMTLTGGLNTTTFAATSGTKTITTNGKTLDFTITFNGVGGTWQLSDNLLQGSTRTTTLTNGTVDLNGKTFTVGSFATAAGTKNLTFNGGTLACSSNFNNAQPANFTTTAGTGTGKISMTGATSKQLVGGGSTYNCTLEQAGAGNLAISGSNTFNDITNTTQPVSVLFTAGTTNTFNNFSLSGTSGNLVTIGSTTAANHTLSKSSGIVNVSYCTISRSTATGGARWQAYTINGNVNGGNNSGWKFSAFSGNGLLFGSNF